MKRRVFLKAAAALAASQALPSIAPAKEVILNISLSGPIWYPQIECDLLLGSMASAEALVRRDFAVAMARDPDLTLCNGLDPGDPR